MYIHVCLALKQHTTSAASKQTVLVWYISLWINAGTNNMVYPGLPLCVCAMSYLFSF